MAFGKLGAFYTLGKTLLGRRRTDIPLSTLAKSVPLMVRDRINGEYTELSWTKLASMAVALVYIVSPIDVIPEAFLMMFGLLDDGLLSAWLLGALIDETQAYVQWARKRGSSSTIAGQLVN